MPRQVKNLQIPCKRSVCFPPSTSCPECPFHAHQDPYLITSPPSLLQVGHVHKYQVPDSLAALPDIMTELWRGRGYGKIHVTINCTSTDSEVSLDFYFLPSWEIECWFSYYAYL